MRTSGQFSRWGLHTGTAPRSGARGRTSQCQHGARLGTYPTGQNGAQARERRPPVGTAARSAAGETDLKQRDGPYSNGYFNRSGGADAEHPAGQRYAVRPPSAGGADQRSAFPCLLRHAADQQYAVSRRCRAAMPAFSRWGLGDRPSRAGAPSSLIDVPGLRPSVQSLNAMLFRLFLVPLLLALAPAAAAQDAPIFTGDFPAAEFQARRRAVMDAIGPGAIALLQGAPSPLGYIRFRQTNSFYYLSGVETPHAYLVLNGTTGRSSLYLPPQDDRRESSEGRLLTSDDADLAREKTGVADVHPNWKLSDHLARLAWSPNPPVVHTPLAPAELAAMSRDLATRGNSDIANDPWDARPSREAIFVSRLEGRFPRLETRDLTPVLDGARLVKSEREIALITKATRLSGFALMEAMRSTAPGIYERELDAVGKFFFFRDGAQSDAYYSLVATGTNAWYPHYHRGASRLEDGELILMDYAPDVGYYTSDVTRMWPVNGVFNEWQRDLYGFYLACYQAILDAIRPGDAATVMGEAATAWRRSCAIGRSRNPTTGRRRKPSWPPTAAAPPAARTGWVTGWGWRSTMSAMRTGRSPPAWCSPSSRSSGCPKTGSTSASRTSSSSPKTAPKTSRSSFRWRWTPSRR